VNMDVAKSVGMLQEMVPYYILTLTSFGRWDDVLAEPLPPAEMRMPTAMAYYARGVAYAAKGDFANARVALDTVTAINAATPAEGEFKAPISIAMHALMGEIATRSGNPTEGIAHFQEALKIEDKGIYFEPPKWYYPIRQSLGAALLKAGRAPEAEKVYRDDLKNFPENGWSLYGLGAALRAEGKTADANAVEKRFAAAWQGADVKLSGSRF
jgi:tetratricopeptide (TPR) repeat protein